jgi:hypothetical protein
MYELFGFFISLKTLVVVVCVWAIRRGGSLTVFRFLKLDVPFSGIGSKARERGVGPKQDTTEREGPGGGAPGAGV